MSVCAAVVATSADDTIVVSSTAARLHGLWLPQLPDTVHVATAAPDRAGHSMTRTRRPEIAAHRRQLAEVDRTVLAGVAVTTIARTWRDLAEVLTLPALVAAGDSALRLGVSRDELADVVARTSRHRGARMARAAVPLLDGRSRSRPESHLRVAVTFPDLPPFDVNVAVGRDGGGWLAEPDLSNAVAKIALEYQGEEHAELARMRRDLTRFADLRSEAWLVLAYGPAEVFGRPWQIRAEVRRAVLQRAPQLLTSRPRPRVVS